MVSDDLNAPLGQDKKKRLRKLPIGAPQVLAGLLALFGLAVAGWALFVNDPLGGEPIAIVATTPLHATTQAKQETDSDGTQHSRYDGPGASGPNANPATAAKAIAKVPANGKTITIIDGSSGKRQEVVIPDNAGAGPSSRAEKKSAPKVPVDKQLLEMTPQGALPVIGPDGARPFAHYASPRELPANRTDAPRIAIVIGGLGVSDSATAEAFDKLPAPVTFAFTPYGASLEALVARARAEDHEVLLQVPMEPFDYPNSDPGPRTLLTSLGDAQNLDRLHWLMSRFQGYVGLIGFMGAKFAASEQAMTPVMHDAAKRGLIYVDDGASPRSVAGQLAGGNGVPFARADIVLDAVPTPVEIDRALARLEMAARDHGAAVGFVSARPGAIARISEWAKKVETRGYVLVPITMVAVKTKSS